METPSILIIEDDSIYAESLARLIVAEGWTAEIVGTATEGLERARQGTPDVVITDLNLPGTSGLEIITTLHKHKPHLPVILMTAQPTTEAAIEATKRGAFDYILKETRDPTVPLAKIREAIATSRFTSEAVTVPGNAAARETATGVSIIGKSGPMQEVYKAIGRLAATTVTVLIQGETGTGKELVARALWQHSLRAEQPFIAVNCAAIPETLLESELFGHERGAFTGAESRRIGRFEQADHGTIFLDEIGDMSLSTQAKLLRVLQERTIQRLGGRDTVTVDIRVIAATHRRLDEVVKEKQFREDLYYRLNVALIDLPTLRDRKEDIPDLVHYFKLRNWAELGPVNPSISLDATAYLQQQLWPGNVRELENVTRKALLLARGYPITLQTIVDALAKTAPRLVAADQTLNSYLTDLLLRAMRGEIENVQVAITWDIERELYARAMKLAEENQAKAAKWLGVSRPTMREKLRAYGLHPSSNT